MKRIGTITLLMIALSMTSCISSSGTAGSSTGGTTPGIAEGTACGKVLVNMYSQYKATRKVDLTNTTTILNVVELATYCTSLQANRNNSPYKKAFATGLVSGSLGLITDVNSMNTVNTLLSLTGLNSISSSTAGTSPTATSIAVSLVNLFNTFK